MIVVFFIILFVFRNFFSFSGTLSSGDWPFLFQHTITMLPYYPLTSFLWLAPAYQIPIKILSGDFGLPWEITERLLWVFGFPVLGIFSSWYFAKTFFLSKLSQALVILIYLTNTYILMLVGGGQYGVVLSYAFAPFVLAKTVGILSHRHSHESLSSTPIGDGNLDNKSMILDSRFRGNGKKGIFSSKTLWLQSLLLGLVYGIEIMFDPRIFYVLLLAIGLYMVLGIKYYVLEEKTFAILSLAGIIALLLNLFWILPLIFSHGRTLGSALVSDNSLDSLQFFSFGTFEQSFSLLHPNWPENIFGKVHFMQPEFLIVPLIAFSSLLFTGKSKVNPLAGGQKSKMQIKSQKFYSNVTIQQSNNLTIVFFALLGFLGAFLAKGTKEPFGFVYEFLYLHVPGFVAFRDPTKFYLLTALSYSILIPFSLGEIASVLTRHSGNPPVGGASRISLAAHAIGDSGQARMTDYLLYTIFIIFWLFTIRQAAFGTLSGTFQQHQVPSEYYQLEHVLENDKTSGKALWIPKQQRFGFASGNHPAISADIFFKSTNLSDILTKLKTKNAKDLIVKNNITYIIVPYDSQGEIFLSDRKYDEILYKKTLKQVAELPLLTKISGFSKTGVFHIQKENLPIHTAYDKLASMEIDAGKQQLANIGTEISLITLLISSIFVLGIKYYVLGKKFSP